MFTGIKRYTQAREVLIDLLSDRKCRVALEQSVAYEISLICLLEQRFYVDRDGDSVRLCSTCVPHSKGFNEPVMTSEWLRQLPRNCSIYISNIYKQEKYSIDMYFVSRTTRYEAPRKISKYEQRVTVNGTARHSVRSTFDFLRAIRLWTILEEPEEVQFARNFPS